MEPIISPWIIYFASMSDNIITLFIVLAFICGIYTIGKLTVDEEFTKGGMIGCIVFAIIAIVTPSTETIYTMTAVNEITPDNIQVIGKTGKDVVDYITDQIGKAVNDKDEEKED